MAARASELQVRRPEPGERRYQIDPAIVLHRPRETLRFGDVADQAEPVLEPFDRRGGIIDEALDRVGSPTVDHPGDRRHRAPFGEPEGIADVQQHRGSRAERGLGHAGPEAALGEQRRLRIAHDPPDRDRRGEGALDVGRAELGRALPNLGQRPHRHVEQAAQPLVPAQAADVEQQRAAGVGVISREHRPAGEAINQVRVDGADQSIPAGQAGGQVRPFADQPSELRRREIGIDLEPGLAPDQGTVPVVGEASADGVSATALPDDRVMQRTPGRAVEHHDRLALVGDAETSDGIRRPARAPDHLAHHRDHVPPDLFGIMLDPARPRVDLFVPARFQVEDPALAVEQHRLRPGGTLVDGQDEAHARLADVWRSDSAASASPSIVIP